MVSTAPPPFPCNRLFHFVTAHVQICLRKTVAKQTCRRGYEQNEAELLQWSEEERGR